MDSGQCRLQLYLVCMVSHSPCLCLSFGEEELESLCARTDFVLRPWEESNSRAAATKWLVENLEFMSSSDVYIQAL